MAGPKSDLSLAQAIFGPLSAIFESQVQASRAFLNYVLSMGFKQLHTQEELDKLKKIKEDSEGKEGSQATGDHFGSGQNKDLDKMIADAEAHVKIRTLRRKTELNPEEKAELNKHSKEHEGLHYMDFQVKGADGASQEYSIPTLALLPMRPLSIESATVKFAMEVSESYNSDDFRGNAISAKRPWMTIDPIDIKGSIQSKSAESTSSSIEIEIKIGTAPMPAGLESVLTALSNNIIHHSDPNTTQDNG